MDEPEFRALTPFGLIPVLQDGDTLVRESHAILRYLAAKAGRHDLLLDGPAGRAGVEEWMDWVGAELGRASQAPFHSLVLKADVPGGEQAVAASTHAWIRTTTIVDGQLARTGAYLTGDTLTLADVPMGVAVNRWFMTPIDRPDLSAVAAYYNRLSQGEAYRRHVRNGLP